MKAWIITSLSNYEGSVVVLEDGERRFLTGMHRGESAPWLDGEPCELRDRCLRLLSKRERLALGIEGAGRDRSRMEEFWSEWP